MTDEIKKILALAVWAPSGDNSQPWRFSLRGRVLNIYNIPGKDLPFYNFEQRGSLVAIGALVENIVIAAPSFGLQAEVAALTAAEENLAAQITFSPAELPLADPLFPFIQKRRTNRRPYKNQPLTKEQKNILAEAVSGFAGVRIRFAEDADARKRIGAALAENERIVLGTQELHRQFFDDVTWTETQERTQKTGLYLPTLELAKPKQGIFKMASDWNKMRWLKRLGILNLIIKDNAALYASVSALAGFEMDGSTPADFFIVGRAMQRFWLTAESLGLCAHPVTGILFLMQRVFAGQTEGLSAEQVATVKQLYGEIADSFGITAGRLNFILRIGTAMAPSATLSRLDPALQIRE